MLEVVLLVPGAARAAENRPRQTLTLLHTHFVCMCVFDGGRAAISAVFSHAIAFLFPYHLSKITKQLTLLKNSHREELAFFVT